MRPNWRNQYLRYKSYMMNVVQRYKDRTDIKVYLEILLSLATISVFSVFALRPTLLTIAELIKEIDSKRQVVEQLDAKIQNISRSQILMDQERNRLILLETAVPKNSSTEDFIRQLEGLSTKNNLVVRNLTLDPILVRGTNPDIIPASNSEGYNRITFKITAIGEYQNFVDFVKDLESLRRALQLTVINISKQTDSNDQEVLILQLEGQLIYLQQNNQ